MHSMRTTSAIRILCRARSILWRVHDLLRAARHKRPLHERLGLLRVSYFLLCLLGPCLEVC